METKGFHRKLTTILSADVAGYSRLMGEDEAVSAYKKGIERAPNYFLIHASLAATYTLMGRDKEAHAEAAEVLRINPKFSLEWFAKISAYKDRSVTDKLINAMRKAGLPDKPPPAQP